MFSRHSTETTEEYVEALSWRLRWALPSEKAEAIAAETKAHLQDRVEGLVEDGLERTAAETAALSGFGRVSVYSRAVIRSAFEDHISARARQCAALLGCGLFGLGLCINEDWLRTPRYLQAPWNPSAVAYGVWHSVLYCSVIVGMFTLSAFVGKRPQTRLFAGVTIIGALSAFLYSGLNKVVMPDGWTTTRRVIAEHRPDTAYQADLEKDLRLLRLGCRVFTANPSTIPAALKQDGHILIPNRDRFPIELWEYVMRHDDPDVDPFSPSRYDLTYAAYHSANHSMPYHTTDNLEEARTAWRNTGKHWQRHLDLTLHQYVIEERQWTLMQSSMGPRFCIRTALRDAQCVYFGLFFVLLDMFASTCGRFAYRFWKNERNRRRGSYA